MDENLRAKSILGFISDTIITYSFPYNLYENK